jgi:hypothetical protein
MTEPIKRSASYWYRRQQEARILDPDGWRGQLQWCTPITEAEFQSALAACTVTHRFDTDAPDPMLDLICGDEADEVVLTKDQEDLQKWQREMQDAINAMVIRVNNLTADVQGVPRKHSKYRGNWFKMAQEGTSALRSAANSLYIIAQNLPPMLTNVNFLYNTANDINDEMETMNHNLTRIADALESPLWDIERDSRG